MMARGWHRFEILAGCAVLAVALWALIALVLVQARSSALERAEDVGRSVARTLAEYEDSSIRAIDMSLQLLRDEWMRDRAGFAQVVQRHEAHLAKEKVIQAAVVGRDGAVLYSRLPVSPGLNFGDREYFLLHKQRGTDELDISKPVQGRVTGALAIQVTRPLFDRDQRFAGLIVFAVPPPGLESIFNEIRLGADSVITLARADGTVLARAGNLRAARPSLIGSPGLDAAGPMEGLFTGPPAPGQPERLFSYRRLESHPLTVFVSQGVDTVLAPYYAQRNVLLAAGAATTLLLAAVALLLIGRARQRERFAEERERLMLELHDGCIQSIYAIGLALESCRRLVERDPARAAGAIADAGANLNLVIQDLRAFISGERSTPYTEAQFMAEIERMIPQHGPQFTLDVDRRLIGGLSAEEGAHLLRIAREAVSNIVRHANATRATLSLQRRGDAVHLEVTDDGVGVRPVDESRAGLGLHHIQARARKLRGRAQVVPMPERGTRIAVEFPHRA